MAILSRPAYFAYGEDGYSSVIGYEGGKNRVARFNFTTGELGATSISISTTAGTVSKQGGIEQTSIPFYVTTSPTSHANANLLDGYSVTGYVYGSDGEEYHGSADIVLQANTTYYLWFFPKTKTYGWAYWHCNNRFQTDCTTDGVSKYAISISAGVGSSIDVNRLSSDAGLPTGSILDGETIYVNDELQVSFSADTNYAIETKTVNGNAFTSGSIHTVSGDVSIASTAQVLASNVGATNADIGSVSTITVTKYNSEYYHTLQYSFGSLSGYITNNGSVSSNPYRLNETSIAFEIPESFYAEIPNAKTGKCTITCNTYSDISSEEQLGESTSCQITVTATGAPSVDGTVVDTNATTIALTGNANTLIRYKSTAVATIYASGNNSATISSKHINNIPPTDNEQTFNNVSITSFVFEATDSRGYQSYRTITPTMVSYISLTLNPVISRPTPTGSEITMTFSGDFYRGSFGTYSNTLKIQYRYRESNSAAYSPWVTVSSTEYTMGTTSYSTQSTGISLGTNFDYQQSYYFQVRAIDGTEEYPLSTITKTVTVQRGVPVFDWGEGDFEFHVPVTISDGTLTIGNTVITESQLQSLLALL